MVIRQVNGEYFIIQNIFWCHTLYRHPLFPTNIGNIDFDTYLNSSEEREMKHHGRNNVPPGAADEMKPTPEVAAAALGISAPTAPYSW